MLSISISPQMAQFLECFGILMSQQQQEGQKPNQDPNDQLIIITMSGFAASSLSASQKSAQLERKEQTSESGLLEAKRYAYSSMKIGQETAESLRLQSEKLDATEQNIEDSDYLISQSVRYLRGMTWSGTLYNVCSDAAGLFTGPTPRSAHLKDGKSISEATTSSSGTAPLVAPYESKQQRQLYSPSTQPQQTKLDEDLLEISRALDSLKSIGINLNEHLDQQNQQLDRIDSATERLNDKTLAVTMKTTRTVNRTAHDPGKFIGSYQFISNEDGVWLLAADGECLVLTNSADTSTVFDVFLRYDTIVALRNKRTGKFVGRTMWGGVAVAGNYFGSMEEWYYDFESKQEHSGLLCLSKNWGAGGWLKRSDSSVPTASSTGERGSLRMVLDSTTSSVQDKAHCVSFRAIQCSPANNQSS